MKNTNLTMNSKQDRSLSSDAGGSFCSLCRSFAMQSSAHGLKRAASARSIYTRVFWVLVFFLALIACTFHCIFLVQNFLNYPRMTITEEIHADEISFPSLTICNLNVLKKSYIKHKMNGESFDSQNNSDMDSDLTTFCHRFIDDFLHRSKTSDLSDIWMSLTVTRDSLLKYGHQENDLLVHCSYNARNCFNQTHSIVDVTAYPSPRYGLCHTVSIKQLPLQSVTRPGLPLGLRLTLNIERDEYLDLLSPEYGARLLVHPAGTYPTLQRGGVVLQPGTKTYVSVRMRKIDRLPWPYGDCTKEFDQSPLSEHLRRTGQIGLLKHRIYTYEYCQTLCRDAYLLKQCDCSEEIIQENSKFCDPCNSTQATCRTNFLRRFNRSFKSQECNRYCKPACTDMRYDLTVSRSEWPNPTHHARIVDRWPDYKRKFGRIIQNKTELNVEHIRANFLRVHVFIQEMNFLSVRDVPAYSVSQLFADLGGCLGLYIGVSLITVLEVFELFKSIIFMIQEKWKSRLDLSSVERASDVCYVATTTNSMRSIYRRENTCCSTSKLNKKRPKIKGIATVHLNPRCLSPLRQLPSPIFSKNFANSLQISPTKYSSYSY